MSLPAACPNGACSYAGYGYDLACDRNNIGDWNSIETNARTRWEQRNPGTWERFKDSIKYAFEKVRPTPVAVANGFVRMA